MESYITNEKNGFSIVEALVAIVMVAIFCTAIFRLIPQSSTFVRMANNHHAAINLVRQTIEKNYYLRYPTNTVGTSGWVNDDISTTCPLRDKYGARRFLRIEDNSTSDYKIISARIRWN